MRLLILAAVSTLAIAACSKPTEPASNASGASEPAPAAAPASEEMAGHDMAEHDMSSMTSEMASADAADDASTELTPNDWTFHTYPDRNEVIRLESPGAGSWTISFDVPDLVSVESSQDVELPDGSHQYVVSTRTLKSGNAVATFERRESMDAEAAPVETRIINFMIH